MQAGLRNELLLHFAWPKSYDDRHSQFKFASLFGFTFDDLWFFSLPVDLLSAPAQSSLSSSGYRPCTILVKEVLQLLIVSFHPACHAWLKTL